MKNTFKGAYTDQQRLEYYAQKIHDSGIDITPDPRQWAIIAYACASQGEAGRKPFHQISSHFPRYNYEECDKMYTYCLRTSKLQLSIGTIVKFARDYGIDMSLPKGRPAKSAEQRAEEQKNKMAEMAEMLREQAEWRFNTWRQRPEVKEPGEEWRSVQERDLDTFYCRLKENGLKVTLQDVKAMIFSRDFCTDYDAFREWLYSLKQWNPDTDPDYLSNFYKGHLIFKCPENEDLYDQMLKKWHVAMLALILGCSNENPLMPIFKGKQHIGKSYFARHILPPHLSDYRLEPSPSDRIDKDFIISLSETPLILLDEISFGNSQKADAYKFIVTSEKSNLRDSYGHFREERKRRASLIATTNEDNFIPNTEGTRRYLVVDLLGTKSLIDSPLPYEGTYAQALYLLNNGFDFKPTEKESEIISQLTSQYAELNDCEEVIKTMFRHPTEQDTPIALAAGDIKYELAYRGHRGKDFSTSEIGKAMTRLKFQSKKIKGYTKYLVAMIDYDVRRQENKTDAKDFIPEAS